MTSEVKNKELTINDVDLDEQEEEDRKIDSPSNDIHYYEEYKRAGEAKLKRDEQDALIDALPDLEERVVKSRDEKELRRALAIEKQKLEQIRVSDDVRWDDRKQNERRDEEQKKHKLSTGTTDDPNKPTDPVEPTKPVEPSQPTQPEKKTGLLHK